MMTNPVKNPGKQYKSLRVSVKILQFGRTILKALKVVNCSVGKDGLYNKNKFLSLIFLQRNWF